MTLRYSILAASLLAIRLSAQPCVAFPSNLVPLTSVAYVTAANSNGDHLVVGGLAGTVNAFNAALPLPTQPNQTFCSPQVQLAPGQYFSGVYVPTAAERAGDFSAFAGLLVDPTNKTPFAGGIIPAGQLGAVFAMRIGPVQPPANARGWSSTGSLTGTRQLGVSVLLPDGRVLIAGGQTIGRPQTSDLYDPSTGRFTQVPGPLNLLGLSATLLNNGQVLIVGSQGTSAGAGKLFDPATMQYTPTVPPIADRAYHTATLLRDGTVLLTGGIPVQGTILQSAEIFDPATGKFTATGAMTTGRYSHTATLLADGRVLIAGGYGLNSQELISAEIYNPDTGHFSATGSTLVSSGLHTATLLPGGKVLVGAEAFELFDPASQQFSATGTPATPHQLGTATLLPSGQVLVAGGCHSCATSFVTSATEIYDPASGSFSSAGNMTTPRQNHSAVLLLDGRVLVTGGYGPGGATMPAQPGFVPGGDLGSAELFTSINQGLVTSQSGLTFRAAQGGPSAMQNAVVLSNVDSIPFTVSVKTYAGGAWLKATPSSGTAGPAGPAAGPITLSITADPTGLAAQDFYGAVTLTPTDRKHSPVSIAIVLSIAPAGTAVPPGVSPSALVFLSPPGVSPKPQAFSITNVSSKTITVTGTSTASTAFFDFAPKSPSVNPGQTVSITVTPSSAGLAAGVYRGSIRLTFGDNTVQSVDVLLVVSVSSSASTSVSRQTSGCTATKLLPVITTLGAGFTAPVAWPSPLLVQVVDDCATAVNSGSVTASFTSGDSPISLLPIGGGMWSATWVPLRNDPGTTVRADAQSALLTGTVQVTGNASVNPKVPAIAAGGILSSGDYIGTPALGLLVSIFGVALADGAAQNTSLPLPPVLGSTSVFISGVQLPLLYVSESQVNVLIPYELAMNAPHQMIVQRASTISVPVPIAIFSDQAGILATSGNGLGQGHIYEFDASSFTQTLADAHSPAKAGDILVVYCVGLGAVTPAVKSGDPAPFDHLTFANANVTLTIGGVAAQVLFSGLTPGFAGLYQVNAVMPAGVSPGSQVLVALAAGGRASAGLITMATQ